MIRNKISTTLFRSLLRWNRRPEVVNSKFTLVLEQYGVASLLPPNAVVKNAEGVQAAIYHCFRNHPATQENVDLGFKVLRLLNDRSKQITDLIDAREKRNIKEFQEYVQFRVGQVVQHKELHIRGVITGWKIDENTKSQIVAVLPDLVDSNEFAGFQYLKEEVHIDANTLELVNDKDLHRIINKQISAYFDGYDPIRCRYIPKEGIAEWFSEDLEYLQQHNQEQNHISSTELKQLNTSLYNTKSTILSIGNNLQNIVNKHQELFNICDNVNTNKELLGQSVGKQIIGEINRCISGCIGNMQSVVSPPISSTILSTETDSTNMNNTAPGMNMFQKLKRGGRFLESSLKKHENTSEYSKKKEMFYGSDLIEMNTAAEVTSVYHSIGYLGDCCATIDKLLQLRFQTKGIAHHDGLRVKHTNSTSSCSNTSSSDSTANPSHHIDCASNLTELPDKEPLTTKWNNETSQPAVQFRVGQVVRHKKFGYRGVVSGYDMRPSMDMSAWEGIVGLEHGQEQPVYKVIPDERDVENMLGEGQFRSSYRVAQENLELVTARPDLLVSHPYLPIVFNHFDFTAGCYRSPHMLRYLFDHTQDEATSTVGEEKSATTGTAEESAEATQLWESMMSLDSDTAATGTTATTTSISNTDAQQSVDAVQIKEIYTRIDEVLVELLCELRQSFSTTRRKDALERHAKALPALAKSISDNSGYNSASAADSAALLQAQDESSLLQHRTIAASGGSAQTEKPSLDMKDLLVLLKYSQKQEHALFVESLLWLIWLAHPSPDIIKLTRLSINHAQRGNLNQAIEIITKAIELDVNFGEAYNKRASYHHMLREYDECIVDAEKALEYFPEHVGALSGLALCFEQKRDDAAAIKTVRTALSVHPWAAHLPTMLISMMDNKNNNSISSSSRNRRSNRDSGNMDEVRDT